MFRTMRQYEYNKETKTLTHVPTGTEYRGHIGVGKVATFGKPSFFHKLCSTYGYQKAKEIQQRSIDRGNAIHKKIETVETIVVPEVGDTSWKEVFVYGELLEGAQPVQGSIDDLKADGSDLHLYEYKTKSNPFVWAKYKNDSLEAYYMQIAAYDELLYRTYGVRPETCSLCIVFPSKKYEPEITVLSRRSLDAYYQMFLENLSHFKL